MLLWILLPIFFYWVSTETNSGNERWKMKTLKKTKIEKNNNVSSNPNKNITSIRRFLYIVHITREILLAVGYTSNLTTTQLLTHSTAHPLYPDPHTTKIETKKTNELKLHLTYWIVLLLRLTPPFSNSINRNILNIGLYLFSN